MTTASEFKCRWKVLILRVECLSALGSTHCFIRRSKALGPSTSTYLHWMHIVPIRVGPVSQSKKRQHLSKSAHRRSESRSYISEFSYLARATRVSAASHAVNPSCQRDSKGCLKTSAMNSTAGDLSEFTLSTNKSMIRPKNGGSSLCAWFHWEIYTRSAQEPYSSLCVWIKEDDFVPTCSERSVRYPAALAKV